MEGGLVKEFDSVPSLMGRQKSTFRGMVVEAGLEGSASGVASRAASRAALAALARDAEVAGSDEASGSASPGEGAAATAAAPRPGGLPGLPTFVRRIKDDYDLE